MSAVELLVLSASAFITSAMTAVVGAGGGTALIAIMLLFLPPASAIPVHGAVQLASNTMRVWLLWPHLAWPIIVRFALLMPLASGSDWLYFRGCRRRSFRSWSGASFSRPWRVELSADGGRGIFPSGRSIRSDSQLALST